MSPFVVEGVYEKGTLKLDHPLPLGDQQRVRITVMQTKPSTQKGRGNEH